MPPMRPRLLIAGALALVVLAGAGYAGLRVWRSGHEIHHGNVLGSSTVEFDTSSAADPAVTPPATTAPAGPVEVPWTTYGFDAARTRVASADLKPPFRRVWTRSVGIIEFPPSVVGGVAYLQLQRGPIYALDAATGDVIWRRDYKRCAASEPTVVDGVLYAAYMHPSCAKHESGARGFVVALDAKTGKELWRFNAGVIESSPLVVGNLLYVGSWDQHVYALDLRTHRPRWSFDAGASISGSPAYAKGTVFIGTDDGQLYALDARSGRQRWRATSFASSFGGREYFYAAPAIAYGRVYIGNTDGYVYAFGARSGRLLWATKAGTYVYTAAAVFNRSVYVGTWDGYAVSLDAATGAIRWKRSLPSSIHGAGTVMDGVVYLAAIGDCCFDAQRYVKQGGHGTFGLDARSGRIVWRFADAGYSPLVTDGIRAYVAGRGTIYAFTSR
jgi:outer membrane protein assembly factor BamB